MNANLKSVFPRAARKFSTASVSTIQPHSASLLFFEPASPSNPQPQPRIITTALTTTNTSASTTTSSSSKAPVVYARYTTNSSHPAYAIPPVFFIPPSQSPPIFLRGSYNSQHSQSHERNSYKLDMGAYGIPKRRRTHSSHPSSPADSSNSSGPQADSARPLSPESTSSTSTDDPAAYSLSVQVGEDAYFTRSNALGVADGVGGWKHSRRYTGESHSALLAKKLMHFCSLELSERSLSGESQGGPSPSAGASSAKASTANPATNSSPSFPASPPSSTSQPFADADLDPVKILQHSYEKCIADAHAAGHVTGSTTALLAVLVDNELRIAHLGDCALCLVRDGEMIYRSEEMQHSFNYPFQLGPASSTIPTTHAQKISIPVQPNDILILASDGMGDNLWDEDVLDEVKRFVGAKSPSDSTPPGQSNLSRTVHGSVTNGVLAQRLSEALASRAKRVSERPNDQDAECSSSPNSEASSSSVSSGNGKTRNPTITVGAVSEASAQEAKGATPPISESFRNKEIEEEQEEPEYVSDEVPFGRKAREAGLRFIGGKNDDISVLVAIISGPTAEQTTSNGMHPQLNLHFDRSGFR